MVLLSIFETLPAVLGYFSATILIFVGSFILGVRIRRSLFGHVASAKNLTGFRDFLSNFE